uniref:protein mono-ADP-ribosyltransferase PARP9 isoform X1 n=1 Tax=Jaculus jaculus TaxID=51337 RepID=UPI001E1B2DD3|nr:protein mono-ADP-ribosyltransferase PARP9 isoform X1 [Jaculus jaculus]
MAYSMGVGAAASSKRADSASLEKNYCWQIPISHSDFDIFKSHESQLCEVLQSKFGCISTLSHPALETRNSSSLAHPVFKKRLSPELELSVWHDDLTKHAVDAVVNAANEQLQHRGGLAGALVRAGGQEIQEESRSLIETFGKVATGQVAVTKAGALPCNVIIHAVGPQWVIMGRQRSIELLRLAIKNVLDCVNYKHKGIKTIAIPALSSGIFQFPLDLCTKIILETICAYFQNNPVAGNLREIHLVSNEALTVASFETASKAILGPSELGPRKNQTTLQLAQGLTLHVVQGHIELQKTDVIVNSVNTFDLTSGPITKSILQQAGEEMKWEFDDIKAKLTSNSQLVLVTKGFKLLCRYVYHVLWQPTMMTTYQILKDAMKICLKKCLISDISSISFPTLGTGGMGMNKKTAAQIMFNEVLTFATVYLAKPLTVNFVIFPEDTETYEVFCAEMAGCSKMMNINSHAVSQWTTEEQRRNGHEAGSPAINLMGYSMEDMSEAKAWIQKLLTSQEQHVIENNHILYLGKKEHDILSQLQKTSSVAISEIVSPGKAALEIKGAHANLIEAVLNIERMLSVIQEEVAKKRERSLWSLSEKWTDWKPKYQEEMKETITFLRYPAPPMPELQDRKKQFEECGLHVIKVEQIDNAVLMDAFQKKKEIMERRTLKGCDSHRLFQLVPHQFCNVVCRVGFHRLYSVPGDSKYGAGIEFTKKLKTLAGKIKKLSNTDNLIYVFEAEVLIGSFCQGHTQHIVPPPLSPGAIDAHDSVVDSVSSPEIVVIFNGIQAVPRYLWTCTQDPLWSQGYSSALMFSSWRPWGEFSNGSSVD